MGLPSSAAVAHTPSNSVPRVRGGVARCDSPHAAHAVEDESRAPSAHHPPAIIATSPTCSGSSTSRRARGPPLAASRATCMPRFGCGRGR